MNFTLWKIARFLGREYGNLGYFKAYRRRDGRVFFHFYRWHEARNGASRFIPHYPQ